MRKILLATLLLLFITSYSATNFPKQNDDTKPIKLKVMIDGWTIGYAWILFNDGCWRLGRVIAGYEGGFYWESITSEDTYCCATIKCMKDAEFAAFC